MSSSRDYYKSSRDSSRDALPPIRDVLGDQLDRPARRENPYSFDAVNRALPDTSSSRPRSAWPQSGPTLPPIHSSRSLGYVTSPPTPLATPSSRGQPPYSHSHSSSHSSSHHSSQPRHAPPPSSSHTQSVPYSFDVFRPSSDGLVHASSSSRSQGILRSTRADAGRRSSNPSSHQDPAGDEEEEADGGYKKYVCQHCGKRFGRPSSLKAHEVVHSDDKPFQCSYPGCGKTFGVASNMRRHYRKMHEASSSSSSNAISGTGSADEDDGYHRQSGSGYASTSGGGGYGEDTYMPSPSSAGVSGSGSRSYYTSSKR